MTEKKRSVHEGFNLCCQHTSSIAIKKISERREKISKNIKELKIGIINEKISNFIRLKIGFLLR